MQRAGGALSVMFFYPMTQSILLLLAGVVLAWFGGTLFVDGEKAGEGKIPRTAPYAFSGDEGINVGADHETPVSEDYKQDDNKFTGKIHQVTVEIFPVTKTAAI